ncbi:hypothetical protein VTN02DRAFT_4654 [Thermoascus thermophilus]
MGWVSFPVWVLSEVHSKGGCEVLLCRYHICIFFFFYRLHFYINGIVHRGNSKQSPRIVVRKSGQKTSAQKPWTCVDRASVVTCKRVGSYLYGPLLQAWPRPSRRVSVSTGRGGTSQLRPGPERSRSARCGVKVNPVATIIHNHHYCHSSPLPALYLQFYPSATATRPSLLDPPAAETETETETETPTMSCEPLVPETRVLAIASHVCRSLLWMRGGLWNPFYSLVLFFFEITPFEGWY